MMEESSQLGEAAFSKLRESVAQDELFLQDEEETKAALDEIMSIYLLLQENDQKRYKSRVRENSFLLERAFQRLPFTGREIATNT